MNKYWSLLIYIPYLFPHDYFMDLSPYLQRTIAEWVVYDNDFNKAFSNFKSLKIINKKFQALTEKKKIKYQILSAAVYGDLDLAIQKITKLMDHQSFKSIDADDNCLTELIFSDLRPKVTSFFDHFVPYIAKSSAPKDQEDAAFEVHVLVSELILGTPAILKSVEKQINDDNFPALNFSSLITYTPKEKWQKCLPVYLKALKSLNQMHLKILGRLDGNVYACLLTKAVEYYDLAMIKEILTIKKPFDITSGLYTCISCYENWKIASETIKIMLSLSNEFDANYINTRLYTLHDRQYENRLSQYDLNDIKELMNQIKDIDYEKRHAKRTKLT